METMIVKTLAGYALVACGRNGIAAVLLGDSADAVRDELASMFPGKAFRPAGPDTERIAERVRVLIDDGDEADFELEYGGTPFQRQVWRELLRVGRGETVTYSDLAKRIGASERGARRSAGGRREYARSADPVSSRCAQ